MTRAIRLGDAIGTPIVGHQHPGKKVGLIIADHREFLDAQPMTSRCAWCDWAYTGAAAECRHAALEHRQTEHPRAAKPSREMRANTEAGWRRDRAAREASPEQRGRVLYWTPDRVIAAIQLWAAEHDGQQPLAREWLLRQPDRRFPSVWAVTQRFGTWNNAITSAGFEAKHGGRPPRERIAA